MEEEKFSYIEKPELLKRIRTDRPQFAALWQQLSDKQMTSIPGPQEDWSVKDLIAHIIWWEDHTMDIVQAILAGDEPSLVDDIDETNEQIYNENKTRDLADVLVALESNMEKIEKQIANLNDTQINTIRVGKHLLLDYLVGDTFGHYGVHLGDLQAYLQDLSLE